MAEPARPSYEELEQRLAVAEATLDAIGNGAVDALVVSTPEGPRIYTLQGSDGFYRALVEQMAEGAASVERDGTILYANEALARMVGVPLEGLIGSNLTSHVVADDRAVLAGVLAGTDTTVEAELQVGTQPSSAVDVSVSAREIEISDGTHVMCLILTERTQQRQAEAARRRAEVATERERVARDLHDVVIQSLFAVGLRLRQLDVNLDTQRKDLLETIIDEINDTVVAIRMTIFGLKPPSTSLASALRRLVSDAEPILGFPAAIVMTGAVDTLTPAHAQHDIRAALRESLTNAARHANSTRVTVQVDVCATEFVLRVIDNGNGLPAERHESGLANLRARAASHGGTCAATDNENGRGTCLTWRIPLPG